MGTFSQFNHVTIESMSAKALIAALSYYNNLIRNKKTIEFAKFVERCVEEDPFTHQINIHYNHEAKGELTKYGFISEDGNVMSIEQADLSFNGITTVNHAFYYLYEFEEEKIVTVLNKAKKSE